jgi:membrane protease YdiL (CAAX protease family)
VSERRAALLALVLVGLAPTASIFLSFGTGEGLLGKAAWLASKAWMLGLPLWWHLRVDRQALSWSPVRHGGLGTGFLIGAVFSLVMVLAWVFIGRSRLDVDTFRASLEPFGLTDPTTYLAAAVFWTVGNSVLEEYVFRWFLVEKGEVLFGPGWLTIVASAGIFVLHHFFALWFLGFSISANLLACLGLFVGGAAFSWLYVRYRSIWVPYITHAMCDVVVFAVGYAILFN